jgi:YfiH family protein
VHGAGVVVVDDATAVGPDTADDAGAFPEGDALVSTAPDVVVAVLTADCAPVAIGAPWAFAAVHVGWRGLQAGVVDAAVRALCAMRAASAGTAGPSLVGAVGPAIGPCCYEFSPADLDDVAARWGDSVRATTRQGAPSLDLARAVDAALRRAGVEPVAGPGTCTACGPDAFSHRARHEEERQALYVWRDAGGR